VTGSITNFLDGGQSVEIGVVPIPPDDIIDDGVPFLDTVSIIGVIAAVAVVGGYFVYRRRK